MGDQRGGDGQISLPGRSGPRSTPEIGAEAAMLVVGGALIVAWDSDDANPSIRAQAAITRVRIRRDQVDICGPSHSLHTSVVTDLVTRNDLQPSLARFLQG